MGIGYAAGRKSYDLGHFDAAIVDFEAAYAAYPDKAFLFNIAQSHRQLGNNEKAIEAYRRFLVSGDIKPEMRTQVEAHIEELGGTP